MPGVLSHVVKLAPIEFDENALEHLASCGFDRDLAMLQLMASLGAGQGELQCWCP